MGHFIAGYCRLERFVSRKPRWTESSLPRRERDPSTAGILVRAALASALFETGERKAALGVFDEMLREEEAVLYWPIPFIRALFFRGRIHALRGDEPGARAGGERFLSFWGTGDLDRERVGEARHWVKA